MTRELIEITFGNALTQASRLEECADDMMRLARSKMESVKTDIQSSWKGDSAQAYLQRMNEAANSMVATANKMYQSASTIRRIATIFRDSEIRAIEIAERRDY